MKTVTEQLREAILSSDQSQLQIAKATHIPQPVINRFVRAERGISDKALDKLCRYLGLHLAPRK